MTGTTFPNSGAISFLPMRCSFSLSSGWTATALHVQRSSGLVVAMRT